MKATTLQKRIEKHLTTKKGTIAPRYVKVIDFINHPNWVIYPRKWNRCGSLCSLCDKSDSYISALTLLNIDFETGNDAPRGGVEGFYIRLTKKGQNQVRNFVLANNK